MTFGLTVFVDLVVAVNVGVVLAALLFMRRMAESVSVQEQVFGGPEPSGMRTSRRAHAAAERARLSHRGPFFFGAAEKLETHHRAVAAPRGDGRDPLGRVPFMDATGMHTLSEIIERFHRRGIRVMLVEIQERLARALARAGLLELAGPENVHANLADALRAIRSGAPPAPD